MSDLVIEIDMDRTCTECGAQGTTGAGLCLKCVAKRVVEGLKGISRKDAKAQREE